MRSQTTSSGNVVRRRHAKTSHTVLRDASVLRLCLTTFCATLLLAACSHAPPEGFAPDPGLVGQIRDIRIVTAYARACPGSTIPTTYEAVLADGSRVPFSRTQEGKQYPIQCRKKAAEDGSLDGKAAEEVLLDLNELAKGLKFFSLGAFAVAEQLAEEDVVGVHEKHVNRAETAQRTQSLAPAVWKEV